MTSTDALQLTAVSFWPSGMQSVLLGLLSVGYKRGDLLYLLNIEEDALDRWLAELHRCGWLGSPKDGSYELVARSLMLGQVMLAQLLIHGDMDRMVSAMATRQAPIASEFNAKEQLAARVQRIRAHIALVKANLPEGF